jgi:hypothetical protein
VKPKYDKALIESSAMQLRDSRWQDNEAATLFVEQTMIMFRTHIYAHRIFL